MIMVRVYSRRPHVPAIDVLDWQLIDDIACVFAKYADEGTSLTFTAFDGRGQYEENDLGAFRSAVKSQPQPPYKVSILLEAEAFKADPHLRLLVSLGEKAINRSCSLSSEREELIDHVAARLEDLFRIAHQRAREREAQNFFQLAAVGRTPRYGFSSNPWLVGIGTSAAVAGIVAAITALLH
jgi:hypothetical protein